MMDAVVTRPHLKGLFGLMNRPQEAWAVFLVMRLIKIINREAFSH